MTNTERLPADLLKRKAVVYVRQSTQTQIQMNLESKRRQYELVQEAKRRGAGVVAARICGSGAGDGGSGQGRRNFQG